MRATHRTRQADRQTPLAGKLDIIVVWLTVGISTFMALWWAMGFVPANIVRPWALVTTLLLPISFWLGHRYGQLEVKGRLDGIDQAVNSVMGAAGKVADLRARTARQMRGNIPGYMPMCNTTEPWDQIDDTQIIPRLVAPNSEDSEVIDL